MTIHEQMNLVGRVALITGGAGHVGRMAAETLAELGAHIIILDSDKNASEKAAQLIQDKYAVQSVAIAVDLEDPHFLDQVMPIIEEQFGRLDILMNNAAFTGASNLKGWVADFKEQRVDTWRRALEVNLTAPFALIQSCVDLLKATKGVVINIGSIYGVLGPDMSLYEGGSLGNPAAYAASKGGLLQLTRWLATVLAPDIRVNMISPGGIFRHQPKDFCERYIKKTPLKRMATEEDLKGAIAYFATDLSLYVTGQNLLVDGGWAAW
ncbi:MAG: short-chain dehydrogenase [Gammaproteobacteria bacterium RIFCSPHIGHO2_02_FULL_42_13]|nr:MAG: short-chain dehydrogenase [Gammaproteobacteria bacterium RIFCSPHIGHO2_02_FULL_42_13]OGT70995.1 MAG: short-chain dehydrogenase [Gammaproteobacteria bacterium RIFCSPLOWO2_02_FULL_42_9]